MLRVPGTGGASLQRLRAAGADIRVVSSARDCLDLALANRNRQVVFLGIGFETTSPTIAATVQEALKKRIDNLCVYSVHKLIPPALRALMADPALSVDGFLCPGHVSTIIGAEAYRFIAEAGRAAVITGFEPVDILEGVLMILQQLCEGRPAVAVQYSRAVSPGGNRRALAILDEVFRPAEATWRGLGAIEGSGLLFRETYRHCDAMERFTIPPLASEEVRGCACGDILRGLLEPDGCPLFGRICTPANPVGPCMVSTEGTCAAHYKYQGGRGEAVPPASEVI